MQPYKYFKKFAAEVTKRCGICQATVEQVLPAVFDEIRYQLCECQYPCVPIECFGTFTVVDIPERKRHYTYKCDEIRTLPPTKRIKFRPTRNLRREATELRAFDSSRRSFCHHPQDPPIALRNKLLYQPKKQPLHTELLEVGPKPTPTESSE